MTEQEIKRAMTLLDEDGLAAMAEIRVGRWVVVNDRGVYGTYDTKREAILNRMNCMGASEKDCRTKRYGTGSYSLEIRDVWEPLDKVWQSFNLYRITPDNLLETQEYCILPLLPAWYTDVYSDEYKEWNRSEEEIHGWQLYTEYRGDKPVAYRYGPDWVAMELYCAGGYATPEEAKLRWLEYWEAHK